MKTIRQVCILLATIGAMGLTSTATALPVIGVAVDDFTSPTTVGSTVVRAALGPEAAIKYYIPLTTSGTCTYGVNCGTSSDNGTGGTVMSMFLMFSPVTLVASTLSVNFEDLDLIGANDPAGFFESIQVFDGNGNQLTNLITNIGGLVTGNAATQQLLSLDLGVLTSTTYFAKLKFSASSNGGSNTPEYLIASIDQTTVPAPATLALLSLGLFGMGVGRRWKKKS